MMLRHINKVLLNLLNENIQSSSLKEADSYEGKTARSSSKDQSSNLCHIGLYLPYLESR